MLSRTNEKFKECNLVCVGENTGRLFFFSLRKRIEKEKSDGEIFYKSYLLNLLTVWDL